MRVLAIILSALLLTACSGSHTRPAKPFTDPSSAATIPPRLGDLRLTKITRFSDKKMGFDYAYTGRNVDACSLYIYNAGLIIIDDGIESKAVKQQYLGAKEDVVRAGTLGYYKDVTVLENKEKTVRTTSGEAKYLESDFTLVKGGEPKESFLFITASRDNFFKVRCTYPASLSAEGRKSVSLFMKALTDQIILTAPGNG